MAPHSILMGKDLSSLGPPGVFPAVLEDSTFCTAVLNNPTFKMPHQWSEAHVLTVWTCRQKQNKNYILVNGLFF